MIKSVTSHSKAACALRRTSPATTLFLPVTTLFHIFDKMAASGGPTLGGPILEPLLQPETRIKRWKLELISLVSTGIALASLKSKSSLTCRTSVAS